ncbi:MAG: hypothetical protein QGI60_03930 [archaeon]|nr:hypothetical protein [archaeon]
MKKIIVTTTINKVSSALQKFSQMPGWQLIVVGDLKTPHKEFEELDCIYLGPEAQKEKYPKLSKLLGWNCIQRRNIGFIEAYKLGAEVIATVDDDNIPNKEWGKNLLLGKETEVNFYSTDLICFDPVGATNHKNLWHRGFPLQLLSKRSSAYINPEKKVFCPDVQADFWNGAPDIDAVCRLEHDVCCNFEEKYFPMATNAFSPFNSQNTFISRKALKNYFMFAHIGRMDDIWGSYYLEAAGHKVVYNQPSVCQERNPHNISDDLANEVIGYENNLRLLNALSKSPERIEQFLPKKSWEAFKEYQKLF